MINTNNYEKQAELLLSLPVVALLPTGRTGSDYLQALLENHSEIITFNGHFLVYEEFFDQSLTMTGDPLSPAHIADEFIGKMLHKLISKYDVQEGKDMLGESGNQHFEIDTQLFREHFINLSNFLPMDSRGILLSIHGAYHLCLGRSIEEVKILLHHPHLEYDARRFIKDFPQSRILYTVRDTRASLYSQIANFRRYYPDTNDCESHFVASLKMNLTGPNLLNDLDLNSFSVRLEDLPRQETLRNLAQWLGIHYQDSLLTPTWAGLMWNGDRLSSRVPSNAWSATRTMNNWKSELSKRDQWMLRCLVGSRLKSCDYEDSRPGRIQILLALLATVLPFSMELRYLNPSYIFRRITTNRNGLMQVLETPPFYVIRIKFCMSTLWKEFREFRYN